VDEQIQAQSALDEGDHPSMTPPALECTATQRNRCAQCGRPFGLVRRRRAGQQFCSAACMTEQADSVRKAVRDKARWYAFLTQRG
jgi:ribosomal protein S14